MNLRPMNREEHKYSYKQSRQLAGQTGCIGYLRGPLDSMGFRPELSDLNTEAFRADLGVTLEALRHEGCILENRERMQAYCLEHLDSAMDRESREYGFRMDTDKYAYLLRLNHREGEVYIYCYFREWLDQHMGHARRGIRFITPCYVDLFRLQDGDKIRITTWDDRTLERTCRYVDEYHLEIGSYPREEIYHICQFAELMERNRNTVEPLRAPACQIKNLSQLKKCLKAGSRLEVIGHCRPECIGEMRKVTLANTQGFYSIVDGEPPDSRLNQGNEGKGPVLHWSNAPFWAFQDGVCGLYSDKDHTEQNLIMAFRVLTDAA